MDPKIVDSYVESRIKLLAAIEAPGSNRDPLVELSEAIVSKYLDAPPAKNRTQKGWDLTRRDNGGKVEVKSVSNRSDVPFKNGIPIRFPPMASGSHHDEVAVVMIVDLRPQMILVFTENSAEQCYKADLNKITRKVKTHDKFELTRENLEAIWTKTLNLSQYSVDVISLPWNTQPNAVDIGNDRKRRPI